MASREVHRITSAEPEPADLASRERIYLLMMGTRIVAIVVAVVVPGLWRWVAIAAGVLLPYIAVVLVNQTRTRGTAADPYFIATHKVAITEAPFAGTVIPHEDPGPEREDPGREREDPGPPPGDPTVVIPDPAAPREP